MLPIQTVLVDVVSSRGPRHLGWVDVESGLTTLIFWLYFSGAVMKDMGTKESEVRLNHERIRQFAKTIIGGMHRRDGSYREADDAVLDTLEDWLQKCLTVDREGKSGWALPDPQKDRYAMVGRLDWVLVREKNETTYVGHGGDYRQLWVQTALPSEKWVRRSLLTNGWPSLPSPFLEDIQIATDGRVFFLTKHGSMGLGPASMENGDLIHILPSGSAHFVLRSKLNLTEQSRHLEFNECELVGDCYLHTDATVDCGRPATEGPAVEGSLPFEVLGVRYLENVLPRRQTVWLF